MIFLCAGYIMPSAQIHTPNNMLSCGGYGNHDDDDEREKEVQQEKREGRKKMIKLKDFSTKLHKYLSKTFGVVNLNVEHIHVCHVLSKYSTFGMLIFVYHIRGTRLGIFV